MATNNGSALEILMASLAAEASNAAFIKTPGFIPNYPNGWETLQYISSPGQTLQVPPVQGFLAQGYSDPNDPLSPTIVALALGINWALFFKQYEYSAAPQVSLSSQVSEPSNPSLMIDSLYNSAYLLVRASIWASLKYLGNKPLYICGMGLGGPLAQLAALDLRPSSSRKGPNGELPPLIQAPCYAFSTPNVSNSNLVQYYNQNVKTSQGAVATNTYWAGNPGLTVDFFPTAPSDTNHGLLGNPIAIPNVKLPAIDVPWLERGNSYYLQQLGGPPQTLPNIPSKMVNTPSGYNQALAYTFAQLAAEAYHQAQHLGTGGVGVPNYSLKLVVSSNQPEPVAFIFVSATNIVVAIRGALTWEEELKFTANSIQTIGSIVPKGLVHQGASLFYNDGTSKALKPALLAAIKSVPGYSNLKLFLTGHSLGGAVANLAAMDYATNTASGLKVAGVYTFGATCLAGGDDIFQSAYNTSLGSKSYQIVRAYDKVATALLGSPGFYSPLNNSVVLSGLLQDDENTYHALSGYLQLLNPGA